MATVLLPPAVLYVDQDRLSVYTSNGRLLSVGITNESLFEFEVVSREKLSALIREFILSKKIDPASLTVVFAPSLCFERNFPELPVEQKEGQTQEFFEAVPFDQVLSRVYPFERGSKAIAVNRDIYEALYDIFIQFRFQFFAVVPAYVFTLLGFGAFNTFDAKIAALTLKRADAVKQQTMVLIRQPVRTLQEQEEQLAKEHTPLIMLVFFIFISLVVGLTFLVLSRQASSGPTSSSQLPTAAPVSPSPTGQVVLEASPVAVTKAQLRLTILADTQNQPQARSLVASFSQAGFSNVSLAKSLSARSRILITASSQLPVNLKQEIVGLVQAASPSAVLQENSEELLSVTIDMGL